MRVALALLALVVGLPAALLALVLDGAPALERPPAPDAAAPHRAVEIRRAFLRLARGRAAELSLASKDFDALAAMAARLHPDLRARVTTGEAGALVEASLGAPPGLGGFWINLAAEVAPSEDGLRLAALRVGRLPLPPMWTLETAAAALDFALGGEAFRGTLGAIAAVRTDGDGVTIAFGEGPPIANVLSGRTLAGIRRFAFRSDADDLSRHYAAQARTGPRTGALGGWLAAALAAAADAAEAGGDPVREMEAALFALGLHCGDARLTVALGRPRGLSDASPCAAIRLGGRQDLRQHFAVSAALHAAASANPAFAVGEIKELYDSLDGSGFSFDDMAANRAGIRFADLALGSAPAAWRAIAALVSEEAAFFPDVSDLPSGLTDAAFEAAFGDADSPAYAAMIAEIDRRLDAATLFAAPAGAAGAAGSGQPSFFSSSGATSKRSPTRP